MAEYGTPVFDGMKDTSSIEAAGPSFIREKIDAREQAAFGLNEQAAPPTVHEALDAVENSLAKLREATYMLADKISPVMFDGPQPVIGEESTAKDPNIANITRRIYEHRNFIDDVVVYVNTLRGRTSL